MMPLDLKEGSQVTLPAEAAGEQERVHVFSQWEVDAVNAALGAGRPLLVRGEPGIGKTQLAEAVAAQSGRVLLPFAVDARSESRDLLWHLDTVQRLADAQLLGAARELLPVSRSQDENKQTTQGEPCRHDRIDELLGGLREILALENYLRPGPLWWAFDWENARIQAEKVHVAPPSLSKPTAGCLVLIDEIDKAESDFPNGLLEALGSRRFTPWGRVNAVTAQDEPPLVIITTNEERALPDAFVRRCLVLHLTLPDHPNGLIQHLVERGQAHFPDADESVLRQAAAMLVEDRSHADANQWFPLPGQAEYLDLLRAVMALKNTPEAQCACLVELRRYVLMKHPEAARAAPDPSTRSSNDEAALASD
ncbi:AAA family ATPase [Marichromatium gracile]|uniref:Dynein-related subfamily AAA family protein n=1 Tax=Marichromatium gracile TaxID=1048 RepID=A0A4R4A8F9_MARGR|nr:MoxR family ATPase [Marichromatium gracile]MBK1708044.1 hypothetical protein [Marichromatium gracile]TCW35171.1 dynein-related subfamily AAA family protein [Marichromatium gracile]